MPFHFFFGGRENRYVYDDYCAAFHSVVAVVVVVVVVVVVWFGFFVRVLGFYTLFADSNGTTSQCCLIFLVNFF